MKTFAAFLFAVLICSTAKATVIVTFDELSGYTGTAVPPGTGQYFDGYGFGATSGTWTSGGLEFNTNQFGPGWSYSNVNDRFLEGFTNQWAAYTGTDVTGNGNYAMAYSFQPNGALINFPTLSIVNSVFVTNATYAALSMLNGDSFAKKFGGPTGNDPDWFKLTFTGFSERNAGGMAVGSQEFYLADYRFADNSQDYIVSSWSLVNLVSLGQVRSIGIVLESSDNHPSWGMNTPAYFAMDHLSYSVVPEPTSLALLAAAGFCYTFRLRQRSKSQ